MVALSILARLDSDLEAYEEALRLYLEREGYDFHMAGLGAFPSVARPRVIWAGVDEPSGSLARIYTALEDSMCGLGWDREKRRFNPHLTIGRVKGNINIARLAEAVRGLSDRTWGHQTVSDLTLYRSHLGPSGARYEVLRTFPLSPV